MPTMPTTPSIAIACQGGGSHTAFTAGVLSRLLEEENLSIRAISGTSGGAICALLTWYGLLLGDRSRGRDLLRAFWADNAALTFWDQILNHWLVAGARLRGKLALPEVSPYHIPDFARQVFQELLERHVDFPGIEALVRPDSPDLYIGAVEILTGRFQVFRNQQVTVEAILASAAIPNLFRAVHIDSGPDAGLYWDGLFSQNPPVADLARSKPDEIWVIQINPRTTSREPQSVEAILDRRNELAGNLSLEQELKFIEKINEFVERGVLTDPAYKHIRIRRLGLDLELDYASKLDRSPDFLGQLIELGHSEADNFLAARQQAA